MRFSVVSRYRYKWKPTRYNERIAKERKTHLPNSLLKAIRKIMEKPLMEMLRNTAFLTLVVFTFTLFTPMLMPPKEAEADMVGDIITGVTVYVLIEGTKHAYGWVRQKIQSHSSGSEHPDNHPTAADGEECNASDCTTIVTSSGHHIKQCSSCKTVYFTCEGHMCD